MAIQWKMYRPCGTGTTFLQVLQHVSVRYHPFRATGDPEAGYADMGIRMKTNHTRLYGLNLSRCLGDKFLKNEDLGLSAEPYVSPVLRFDLAQRGVALLASDGLWDVMEPSAAMQVAATIFAPKATCTYIWEKASHDTLAALL